MMKRRDLLRGGAAMMVGVAAGCDRNGDSKSKQPEPARPAPSPDLPSPTEVRPRPVQRDASPFVFAGSRFAVLGGGKLRVHDASTGALELTLDVERGHGIGALADGSVAVLEDTPQGRIAVLRPGQTTFEKFTGIFSTAAKRHARLLAGKSADEVVVVNPVRNTEVEVLALAKGEARATQTLSLRLGNDFDTLVVLPGASLAYADSAGVHRLEPASGKKTAYATRPAAALLAPTATDGAVWAARDGALVRLTLADPVAVAATIQLDAHHIAAVGDGVGALRIDGFEAGSVTRASLAVYDANANERWTAPVASTGRTFSKWVAASATRVAVGTAADVTLHDASDGKPIG